MTPVTPWFPDHTRPTRRGWYDTRRLNPFGMARVARRTPLGGIRREQPKVVTIRLYWNGRAWTASPSSTNADLFFQRREWRGVSHAKVFTTFINGRRFTKTTLSDLE